MPCRLEWALRPADTASTGDLLDEKGLEEASPRELKFLLRPEETLRGGNLRGV
jgi:hypothetical protein